MNTSTDPDADLIAALGFLTLGSRFRRLGEQLQAGVSAFTRDAGLDIQASQFPILAAVKETPLAVGELSQRLGLSQPGITRALAKLTDSGLIEMTDCPQDMRRRTAALSAKGRAALTLAEETLFPAVENAVAVLCSGPNDSLLGQLGRLDNRLRETAFEVRLRRSYEERKRTS